MQPVHQGSHVALSGFAAHLYFLPFVELPRPRISTVSRRCLPDTINSRQSSTPTAISPHVRVQAAGEVWPAAVVVSYPQIFPQPAKDGGCRVPISTGSWCLEYEDLRIQLPDLEK
ncbi:hypothetical protein N7510_008322 [Penicillium lagena]|uniref:uncharacterized protein n=1 Tax=Penicillium lagena TaxID=94218 RepID=UPI00254235B6|nr:uncharacterized protein N7510_008322 [Penicillium lagena]KAJ5605541.1 hypothetical protein N7510_008322 [Penicillium lagena]